MLPNPKVFKNDTLFEFKGQKLTANDWLSSLTTFVRTWFKDWRRKMSKSQNQECRTACAKEDLG